MPTEASNKNLVILFLASIMLIILLILFLVMPFTLLLLAFPAALVSKRSYNQKKDAARAIFLFLSITLLLSTVLYAVAEVYNSHYGKACEKDSDCRFACGTGCISKNYISVTQENFFFFMFGGDIVCTKMQASCNQGTCICWRARN
ncbi:MAG: hypothetical protein N3F05_01760 [Candidatus Diapherotrites archaeon]|nr:hypothetical protein [Candidatus Diapherotrites archaeon]